MIIASYDSIFFISPIVTNKQENEQIDSITTPTKTNQEFPSPKTRYTSPFFSFSLTFSQYKQKTTPSLILYCKKSN